MSGAAGMDLRLPIGGLFVTLGLLLAGYGVATAGNTAQYASAGGLNINLWWGLAMLAFGLGCVLLARRAARQGRTGGARPAMETSEGRATERREQVLGLEQEER